MLESTRWFYQKFQTFGERPAIIERGHVYPYSKLIRKIDEYDSFVRQNIRKGEIIVLLSDYSFSAIALFFSLIHNKNIVILVISDTAAEIDKRTTISRAEKLLSFSKDHWNIQSLQPEISYPLYDRLRKLNHSGLVLFSSGITGEPKAMVHDLDVLSDSYQKEITKEINSILFLTFDHIGGIDTLFSLLSIGGCLTIPEERDPGSICKLIEKHRVNVLSSSPTFLNLLLLSETYKHFDLSSLQIIGFGAEQMPEFLFRRLKELFPGVRLQQKFGTSETNAIRVRNHATDDLYMKIKDPNISYKIIDNELWLKSSTQILGYLNASSDNIAEGWFKTGDIVEENEDGYFRIVGRKNEIINVGGEKVFPGEVENAILQVKDVKDCIVYGEKNVITGETVIAEVVIKPGIEADLMKKQIREHLVKVLDVYKRPAKIKFVENITFNERFKKMRRG
jgi:acyl-coenzyme A synthetase/AMP-(fatty) acid ligase